MSDWTRGKYSVPLSVARGLEKLSGVPMPQQSETRRPYWWTPRAACRAGHAVFQKYGQIGDPEFRRKRWREWWEREGKYFSKFPFRPKSLRLPQRSSNLAEFVGILLGDGGITPRQVIVTLSTETDGPYSVFVKKLFYSLFDLQPAMYRRQNIVNLTVSRTRLVRYCQSLGLPVGSKIRHNADIPSWIKRRSLLLSACIRGLMDTDGCLFRECHKINGRRYCYFRLSFVNYAPRLRASVAQGLQRLGFTPRVRNNRSVQLEDSREIHRYFREIGSHNPKHARKLSLARGRVG